MTLLCQEEVKLQSWVFKRFRPARAALPSVRAYFIFICCTDNTAGLYTRRTGFRQVQQSAYLVAVVISDRGFPVMSSTGTLTVRVCTCDRNGNMEMCNAEALSGTAGLSTGALVAILLCVIILLRKCDSEIKK